jgi:hypothetical protein
MTPGTTGVMPPGTDTTRRDTSRKQP